MAEFALVNLIRHAERYLKTDVPDIHLAPVGYERASYIGNCVGNATHRTLAFPLGPPSRLIASVRPPSKDGSGESDRPYETLLPLSRKVCLLCSRALPYPTPHVCLGHRFQDTLTPHRKYADVQGRFRFRRQPSAHARGRDALCCMAGRPSFSKSFCTHLGWVYY